MVPVIYGLLTLEDEAAIRTEYGGAVVFGGCVVGPTATACLECRFPLSDDADIQPAQPQLVPLPAHSSSPRNWQVRGIEEHGQRRSLALEWMRAEVGPSGWPRLTELDADRFLSWLDQDVRPGATPAELTRLAQVNLRAYLDYLRKHDAAVKDNKYAIGTEQDRAHAAGIHLVRGGSPGLGKKR